MTINDIIALQLYPRHLGSKIAEWLESDHILLITGSRQVGKTSQLFLLIQQLVGKGFPKQHIHYFDLEDFDLLEICNLGPKRFVQYLRNLGEDFAGRCYVFIDEIQYLDDPTNFLKLLHDRYKNIKIICSGSSTLEIQRKFKDSLVGRKLVFELFPLSFEEYLLFKQQETLLNIVKKYNLIDLMKGREIEDLLPIFAKELEHYFDEYIRFGGYPAGVLEQNYERKIILLNEIYQTYVRKDINQLFTIENVAAFNNLLRLLGLQIGQLVNLKELATSTASSWRTIENYLFILENTFIIKKVLPFFSNKRKEVIKMPKIFFHDTGLRNQLIKNTNSLAHRNDAGSLVENFVFGQLYRNLGVHEELKFWRTQNKNEVDFVIESQDIIPIEVKYKVSQSPQIPQGIRFFIQQYHCKIAFVVTKNFLGEIEKEDCRIIFLPAYLLSMNRLRLANESVSQEIAAR